MLPLESWSLPHDIDQAMAWPPARILFLVVLLVVLRGISHRLINIGVKRLVQSKSSRIGLSPRLGEQRREQRITALGSMARGAATAVITFIIVMWIFQELGFNITTLVAGTSVVGVAVAFGVQSILKDLLSGIFMLIEDQLGVGDYVDLDKASGTVESVGLRVTQLRDDHGNRWYVRNGEVLRVGNFSQGGSDRPVPPPAAAWTLAWSPAKSSPELSRTTVPEDLDPADPAPARRRPDQGSSSEDGSAGEQ